MCDKCDGSSNIIHPEKISDLEQVPTYGTLSNLLSDCSIIVPLESATTFVFSYELDSNSDKLLVYV